MRRTFVLLMLVSFSSVLFAQSGGNQLLDGLLFQEPLIYFPSQENGIDISRYQYLKEVKQAEIHSENKDFLSALQIYNDIYRRNPDDLTATLGLANSFFVLGDYKSAELYYQLLEEKFTEDSSRFDLLRYRRASIYFLEKEEEKFEAELLRVVEKNTDDFTNAGSIAINDGIDEVFNFYQVPFDTSFYAFRELGIYYLSKGDTDRGINYVAYAFSMIMNHINDYLKSVYPSYQYTDVRSTFESVRKNSNTIQGLQAFEMERMLAAFYYATIEKKDADESAYNARYIYSLLEFFDRNVEIFVKDFSYFPFLP